MNQRLCALPCGGVISWRCEDGGGEETPLDRFLRCPDPEHDRMPMGRWEEGARKESKEGPPIPGPLSLASIRWHLK